jgi:hypothetical protein
MSKSFIVFIVKLLMWQESERGTKKKKEKKEGANRDKLGLYFQHTRYN